MSLLPQAQTNLPEVITGQRSGPPETRKEEGRLAASRSARAPATRAWPSARGSVGQWAVFGPARQAWPALPLPTRHAPLPLTPWHPLFRHSPRSSQTFTPGFSEAICGNLWGSPMTLRAAAGVRGGGDEVLEVGAKGMGAALTGPVPRWGGLEDPGFLRWPGRLRG